MKRALPILLLASSLAFAAGGFALGFSPDGGLELGGGGFGRVGALYLGGLGAGGATGGYGLGFAGYEAWRTRRPGLDLALVPRLGLGGGAGKGWAGFLVEPGVWLLAGREGLALSLFAGYQWRPGGGRLLLRLGAVGGRW